ncbi:MAG: hypothetical protein H7A25_22435 [Leptospiraceae bacterium]|nr:hypothetical protein [Leptospiraceae bacterium]MCP5502673.1 hypothetical protein [Leptospiraceae bacterium]
MRDYFKENIQEALDATNYRMEEMSPLESIFFRQKVSEKFADGRDYSSLFWEAVATTGKGFSIRSDESWKWLDDFLEYKEYILFFEKSDDSTIYIFPEKQSIVKFLHEFPINVLYITNDYLDYFISFNDSDYLHCIGTAESWLKTKALELSKTGWRDMDGKSYLHLELS